MNKWRRYRFHTAAAEDYRPLVFNTAYPWWCTGFAGDSVVIVAYLPVNEPLDVYWPDATDVTHQDRDEITFTDRFPKPDWYQE